MFNKSNKIKKQNKTKQTKKTPITCGFSLTAQNSALAKQFETIDFYDFH